MNLSRRGLAIRLAKDKDAGDLEPLVLTYPGDALAIPIQLTSVPGDPRWHSSRVWMVGLSLALAASALLAERRTGLALRLRRRRPTSRPSPASEARVRP